MKEHVLIDKIKNEYSVWSKIVLGCRVIYTKLFFKKARLIRGGFIVRGKKMIDFGRSLTTGYNCRIEAFITGEDIVKKIVFGDRVQLNDNVHISSLLSVRIGSDVLVASHCYISDNSHGSYKGDKYDTSPLIPPSQRGYIANAVEIGDRVWIGEGVMIMPGVSIGSGSIVGAHSIVKTDIPPNCIAVGSPARVVKKWDDLTNHWIKL